MLGTLLIKVVPAQSDAVQRFGEKVNFLCMEQADALWANSGRPRFLAAGERVTSFGLVSPGGVPCAGLRQLTSRPIAAKSGAAKNLSSALAEAAQQVSIPSNLITHHICLLSAVTSDLHECQQKSESENFSGQAKRTAWCCQEVLSPIKNCAADSKP